MGYALQDIVDHIGGQLHGDGRLIITGPAGVDDAGPDQIAFVDGAERVRQASEGHAGALVVGQAFPQLPGRNLLYVEQPRLGFLRVMELFVPKPGATGIDVRAVVDASAVIGDEVSIGACAVIGAQTRIGARTRIHPGAVIGCGVTLGEDSEIGPNATVMDGVRIGARCVIHAGATIGGDGFGFQWLGDHHHKIPQLGTVVLEDEVDVGCNSCIDRATLGETRIGRGTKIDNQVHVGHNNRIGDHVILVAQVGLSGSVTVGDGAILAGQVGVVDHVEIGAGAKIGGAAVVSRDIPAGATVWGVPARPMQRVLRERAAAGRLPEALKELRIHERRIAALEGERETARALEQTQHD